MSETKALVRIDPQALLTRAVEGNASIETLERLVALAKDVREVQAREAWHEAMAAFQRTCPPIKKSKKADIITARGSYSYHYAPLDEIMEIIRPLLGELGLSVSWSSRVEPQRVVVACRVAHILGHTENSGEISMPIPDSSERGGGNPAQRVGSALTYARRYSLLQVTGLAPEDDDDAAVLERPTKPKAAPIPPQEDPDPSNQSPPETEIAWDAELGMAPNLDDLKATWSRLLKSDDWKNVGKDAQEELTLIKERRKKELSG